MSQLRSQFGLGSVAKHGPGRDTYNDRITALEKIVKSLTVAQGIGYTTVPPDAPIVEYISGNAVPLADGPGVVVDQSTSFGPLKVWQASTGDDALFAVGLAGDAFPRIVCYADPANGFCMGDGTFDPAGGAEFAFAADGSALMSGGPSGLGHATLRAGSSAEFVNFGSAGNVSEGPIAVSMLGGSVVVNSCPQDPNGSCGGNVNDVCIRTDLSGGAWIYRCTTAGDFTTAVWTVAVST